VVIFFSNQNVCASGRCKVLRIGSVRVYTDLFKLVRELANRVLEEILNKKEATVNVRYS